MDTTARAAALAMALAISTVAAEPFPPPMDVMGPYDTPAAAADRISVPEDVGQLGAQRAEAGLENSAAAPPEGAGLLDLPGDRTGGQSAADLLDLAGAGRGDKDDGNSGDDGDKEEKPEKPEKPDDGDDKDDDNDGDG